ncbi:MAG TPA: cytidine/deoxycytidylate deaminase family protein [Candidatus Sumerlaeia bacterium]|nr:cytidine/deoxycytidylate deaminase family protein [Candidatus Sumerlaeia bacterium]
MTSEKRPTWDEYFMEVAQVVRKRSTFLRRQVGAVLVKDKRILATGYNGAPSGLEHCSEVGCLRQQMNIPSGERHEICRGAHAEQNAIAQAALLGVSTRDSEIYVTAHPCSVCAKILINAGVKRIVFEGVYPDPLSVEMLACSHVKTEKYNPSKKTEKKEAK